MRLSVQSRETAVRILARKMPSRTCSGVMCVLKESWPDNIRSISFFVQSRLRYVDGPASTAKSVCEQRQLHRGGGPRGVGAVFTISGFVAASSAMDFIASMKRSHSSLDSDSVARYIAPHNQRKRRGVG